MSTVSSKHMPRPVGQPPLTVVQGDTLVDDMEIIRKLCLPDRNPGQDRNVSSLTFGKPDTTPFQSTAQGAYGPPGAVGDTRAQREARSRDMNSKHFEFGFGAVPPAVSENRGKFEPHGPPRNKQIHNIGGPNDKNASTIFLGDPHSWAADLASTNHADFVRPDCLKNPVNRKIADDHRANHFDFGNDEPDMESEAGRRYKAPPPGFQPPPPAKGLAPGVQLGSPDFPWGREVNSTNRADFAQPFLAEEDALTEFAKRTPLCLGTDKREMLTEQRGAYKKNEYLDCRDLSDQQLTMLGVTREQILPAKVPLHLLTGSSFRSSLGQSRGATM